MDRRMLPWIGGGCWHCLEVVAKVLEAVNSMVVILEVADLALASLEVVVAESMMQQ